MKIKYRIVDMAGDEINPDHCPNFTPIPVEIRTVEFRQSADPKDERVMIITLEYLHGVRSNYKPF